MLRIVRVLFFIFTFSLGGETLRLSLEDCISIASKQNKLLAELSQTTLAAKSKRKEEISRWLPSIKGTYYMYQDSIHNVMSNAKSNFLTHIQLTQEVFSADTYYSIALAGQGITLVEELFQSALNDVLFAVQVQYYTIITDYHLLEAATEHVRLLQQLAQQMQDRYQIGTSIEYAVNQSKVAVANATRTYYKRLKKTKDDLDTLAELLGYMPGEIDITLLANSIPLSEIPSLRSRIDTVETLFTGNAAEGPLFTPDFLSNERSLLTKLYSQEEVYAYSAIALRANPVIKKMQADLSIAQEKVREAYGKYLPQIAVKANVGGIPDPFDFYPSSHFSNMNFDFGIGLNFSWLIFDSFGREHSITTAKYKRSATELKLEKEKQTIVKEVRNQIHSLEESIAVYVTAKSNALLADQTLTQAMYELEVGYIDIFDYQISVDALIQAKTAEVEAKFEVIHAYYGLSHALGGTKL